MKLPITRICVHQNGENRTDVNIYRENMYTCYNDITKATRERLTNLTYQKNKYQVTAIIKSEISIFINPVNQESK